MAGFLSIDIQPPPGNNPPTAGAAPLVARLSTSHFTNGPGDPLRITLTLKNVSKAKVRVAPFADRAEITLLRGSTVVATARKRLSPGAQDDLGRKLEPAPDNGPGGPNSTGGGIRAGARHVHDRGGRRGLHGRDYVEIGSLLNR